MDQSEQTGSVESQSGQGKKMLECKRILQTQARMHLLLISLFIDRLNLSFVTQMYCGLLCCRHIPAGIVQQSSKKNNEMLELGLK